MLLLHRNAERGPHRWVAVGGRVEAGESPEGAAVREVAEETGLDVEETIFPLDCGYVFERDGRTFREETLAALAPEHWEPRLDPSEHDGCAWFPLAEASERLAWPENRAALAALVARLERAAAADQSAERPTRQPAP